MRTNPQSEATFTAPIIRFSNWTVNHVIPTVTATAVAGTSRIISAVTFGALLFGGANPEYALTGIAMMLTGALVIGLIVALFTSRPALVASPQDAPAMMVATLAVTLTHIMPADQTLPTLLVITLIITLATGICLLIMGWLRLGRLVHYVPSFVSGGFLAATGWLLTQGALKTLTGIPLTLATLPVYVTPAVSAPIVSALAGAFLLLIVARRSRTSLALPSAVFLLAIIFIGWGVAHPQAGTENEWLFAAGGPSLARMSPLAMAPNMMADGITIDWMLILGQGQTIIAVVIISAVLLMVNANGFALSAGQDVDMDRELKVAGLANLCSGLTGGFTGYHVLSNSMLIHKLGARNRLPGVGAALICGAALFGGGSILAYVPRTLLGCLLLFIGIGFLVDWLIGGWRALSRRDYALMVLLFLTVALFGFVAGVLVGMAFTLATIPETLRAKRQFTNSLGMKD